MFDSLIVAVSFRAVVTFYGQIMLRSIKIARERAIQSAYISYSFVIVIISDYGVD